MPMHKQTGLDPMGTGEDGPDARGDIQSPNRSKRA